MTSCICKNQTDITDEKSPLSSDPDVPPVFATQSDGAKSPNSAISHATGLATTERGGCLATDSLLPTAGEIDTENETLDHHNIPALRQAKAELVMQHKKKHLNIFFRARITNMIALINLYIDPELDYGWIKCSELAARAGGKGAVNHARNLRRWVVEYIRNKRLPLSHYGRMNSSILEDEDLAGKLHLHLTSTAKDGYICAQDVVDAMATPEMKHYLGIKSGISIHTGRRWLNKMEWRYEKSTKGMYIDGHERDDVVKYRKEFLTRMEEYSKRMTTYDRDGNIVSDPTDIDFAAEKYPLVLLVHDESTFTLYDRRKTKWSHADIAQPEPKGEGPSLMVSEILTQE